MKEFKIDINLIENIKRHPSSSKTFVSKYPFLGFVIKNCNIQSALGDVGYRVIR